MIETEKQGCVILKAGQLAMLTKGDYSDYSPLFAVRAVRDFDVAEQMAIFKSAGTKGWRAQQRFALWLLAQGLVEEVECVEVHLGAYDLTEVTVENEWTAACLSGPGV